MSAAHRNPAVDLSSQCGHPVNDMLWIVILPALSCVVVESWQNGRKNMIPHTFSPQDAHEMMLDDGCTNVRTGFWCNFS